MKDLLLDFRNRRSVRKFRPDPVDVSLLGALLESATWAPSAGNRQDWLFTIVTSKEVIAETASLSRERWAEIVRANSGLGAMDEIRDYAGRLGEIPEAPVLIAVSCPRPNALLRRLLGDGNSVVGSFTSAAMAAENLLLAASLAGLGSCCLTGPLAAAEKISAVLKIPDKHEMVCFISIGWPAEEPQAPPRKPLDKVTRFIA